MTLADRTARAYDVRLVPDRGDHEVLPPDFAWGPSGHGCSPSERFVLLHPVLGDALLDDPVHVFHEVTHVVVHPPFADMRHFPEDLVQLPFERALARRFRAEVPRDLRLLHQQTPMSESWPYDMGASFDENDQVLEATPMWRAGIAVGQFVGLLDEKGRVRLGAWPQWDRLSAERWAWLFALPAADRLDEVTRWLT